MKSRLASVGKFAGSYWFSRIGKDGSRLLFIEVSALLMNKRNMSARRSVLRNSPWQNQQQRRKIRGFSSPE
jgi:hypothetical protein